MVVGDPLWYQFCFTLGCLHNNHSNFDRGLNVKIIIGITHEPSTIKEYLIHHHGQAGSMTEIGPFASKMEALNWLVYLKSRIGDFEEIIPRDQSGNGSVWYGFTFEKTTTT